MNLLKNVKTYCGVLGFAGMLCSCSSATFPDIVDDEQSAAEEQQSNFVTMRGTQLEQPMPQESNSLTADKQNAAYDEEDKKFESAMSDDFSNDNDEENAKPVKGMPVVVAEDEDMSEEETIVEPTVMTQDDGTPSVSYRLETFYFENGSSTLDSKYNSKIREIAKMAKNKKAMVKVLGYASSRTRNTDAASHKLANFKVSSERAQSVANALKRNGLSMDKIEVEALSDSDPAYQEVMPEGERLNRRVEIYIEY